MPGVMELYNTNESLERLRHAHTAAWSMFKSLEGALYMLIPVKSSQSVSVPERLTWVKLSKVAPCAGIIKRQKEKENIVE